MLHCKMSLAIVLNPANIGEVALNGVDALNIEIKRRTWEAPNTPIARSPGSPNWRPRVTELRIRAFAWLILLDSAAIMLSFVAAVALRGESVTKPGWLLVVAVLLPVYLVTALNSHAFSSDTIQDPFSAVGQGLKSLVLALAAVIFVAYYLKTSERFPRLTVAVGSVFSLATIAAFRYYFTRHLVSFIGGNPFSVLLIVDDEEPIPQGNFSIVVSAQDLFDPDVHEPSMYDRLATSLAGFDRVVVACPPERRHSWANALKGANVQGEIVIPEFKGYIPPIGIGMHDDTPTLIVANGPLQLVDRGVKRFFDVLTATTALVLLAPFFAVVAIAIKLDSPGPVLFQQVRIGRANQMFRMLKFRSMRVETCDSAGGVSTARQDDRITRVGHFIRKTSIDELPQLINVLLGQMSIVGPRPHALGSRAENKLFWEIDTRYWHRHAARPGLTGLAQVRGFRGATLREDDLRQRLQADLEYLDTWSIWRDLKIVILTFRVLLHRNAF